jgi:L-lysine exporter family protein LysE/ArgO
MSRRTLLRTAAACVAFVAGVAPTPPLTARSIAMHTPALVAGALLTAGLIVAIGPQNLHVLRTGLDRRHVGATVLLCIAADALFVGVALGGAGAALAAAPQLQGLLQAAAVPLLLWMAWRAARDAWAPPRAVPPAAGGSVLAQIALVSFGNPAVWIETLLVFGSAAAAREGPERLAFGAGALLASALWFAALGFGARLARRWLARPAVLRGLSGASALLLAAMAWRLAAGGSA